MSKSQKMISACVSDWRRTCAHRSVNAFLLQDALIGLFILIIVLSIFASACFLYYKSEVGIEQNIKKEWVSID